MSKLSQHCSRAKWKWHRALEKAHQQEIDEFCHPDPIIEAMEAEEKLHERDLDDWNDDLLDHHDDYWYDEYWDEPLYYEDIYGPDEDVYESVPHIDEYRHWRESCLLTLNNRVRELEIELIRLKAQLYDRMIGRG